MSKKKIRPRGIVSGPKPNKGGMLQQLQTLQEDMLKAQDEIAAMSVTASAGGGAVNRSPSRRRWWIRRMWRCCKT